MVPASFDEANTVLNPPPSMSPDECEPLNVWRGPTQDGPVVISCWKLTEEELEEVQRTGRIWLWVFGETMPPCVLIGKHPFNSEA